MSATLIPSHVVPDEHGVLRVGGVKFIMFVTNHVYSKMDAAALHEQYPKLSLADIHGALAYYYDNKAAFDAELERREREGEELLKQFATPTEGLREKLEKRLADKRLGNEKQGAA